ncbi:hypothetical protein L3X38_025344 [Prunus dulcis]|uniref:Uncharacterized protein n=1 Tax=Prunus dulcis TaxID=3755 RepID=A0AAD4Z793_PRUDU|nr:hypothetical protein L3X38_025344 [Prunus dulcis]
MCEIMTLSVVWVNTEGNSASAVKEPGLAWMTSFLFLVCFVGLFVLIPLKKIMMVDLKLTYPSGLATVVLINGFHIQGDKMAKKQVHGFMKYFSFSFFWGFFKWFYSAKEECGFAQFPTFGLQAWKYTHTFYFDFRMTFVGASIICSHLVNLSLLLGSVLSFESSYGYKVFLSVPLIRGDGLYNFIKVLISTIINIHDRMKNKNLNLGNESNLTIPFHQES